MKKTEVAMKIKELLTDDIMEAIGKSIAEPVCYDDLYFDEDHRIDINYSCPECETEFDSDLVGIMNYCKECGKKLDWSHAIQDVVEGLCPYFDKENFECMMALKYSDCPRAKEEAKKGIK